MNGGDDWYLVGEHGPEQYISRTSGTFKRCSKCWRYLPLSAFIEDKRTRDRLSYRCRECKGLEPEPTVDEWGK